MSSVIPFACLLGSHISVTKLDTACSRVLHLASLRRPAYVCFATAHMLVEASREGPVQEAYAGADLITADGRPVMWCLRLLRHADAECVSGPMAFPALLAAAAARRMRVAFYGGRSETLDRICRRLERELPNLKIAYVHSPPFRTLTVEEQEQDLLDIEAARPDVLFVGLGSPKQECWMSQFSSRLSCVCLGVGAAFEFFSGEKTLPPEWVQRLGLTWMIRLLQEPRRLGRRNLASPVFVLLFLLQITTGRGNTPYARMGQGTAGERGSIGTAS